MTTTQFFWQQQLNYAADVSVKFQSDRIILNTNLAASGLCEILQGSGIYLA